MSPEIIGIIGLLFLFVLIFAGMPLVFTMALVSLVGLSCIMGLDKALNHFGSNPWVTASTYTFSVIPLFILMGNIASASGIVREAYNAAHAVVGRLPGGLAISTIGACAIFAACTGSSTASAATMVRAVMPEMKRYKYDDGLAMGTIAAGGTLGMLIPPSFPMVIYGLLTETSIGKLLISGVLPGILLSILFMVTILIICLVRPSMGPRSGQVSSWREALASFKDLWKVVLLVGIVLVGIWGGVFTPTEAGALGAFTALVIGLISGGRDFRKQLGPSLKDTVKTTAMIFAVMIGAMLLSLFLAASRLPEALVNFIGALSLSPLLILIITMLIYIFLGCVMDMGAIMFITLPVVFPIIVAIGIDPIWFGLLFIINGEMACITPPIGINVLVISGMTKDVPMYTIFRGAAPFFVAMVICLVLVIAFPQIALFLPSTMIK
jgi:tripartite ATP-independent transporter DctM subunit